MNIMDNMLDFFIKMFHSGIIYSKQVEDGKYESTCVDSEAILRQFCRFKIPRMVFLHKYGKLPCKLSEMDANEKLELKKYVNGIFKSETPEFRLNACKVIFTLNQCL